MNEQERINTAIAYELDKYQVILEYGRVMLGASDDVKRKYYWAMIPNWGIVISVVADIISAMVGSIANIEFLLYIASAVSFLLIYFFVVRFTIRKDLSLLMKREEYYELDSLLKNLNSYLSKLARWISLVDINIQVKKTVIEQISKELEIAKSEQEANINKISNIFGKLKPEWEERAKDFANKRLEQFKRFRYV
jgi:hypothetical protein